MRVYWALGGMVGLLILFVGTCKPKAKAGKESVETVSSRGNQGGQEVLDSEPRRMDLCPVLTLAHQQCLPGREIGGCEAESRVNRTYASMDPAGLNRSSEENARIWQVRPIQEQPRNKTSKVHLEENLQSTRGLNWVWGATEGFI